MTRKIFGGLLFVEAALIVIGLISNGSFMSDQGSAAATNGYFVGTMLPVILNIFGCIFLFRFDRVCKYTYIDGFKARKKQCSIIVLFVVLYAIILFVAGLGAGLSGADNFLFAYIIVILPYFVPMMIFLLMLSVYAIPYWSCNKNFKLDDNMLNEYISVDKTFNIYSEDNSVLASNKVLFFPKTFCIVPFVEIESTKFYNVIEQDIIFKLTNGKKVEIVANKKKYDSVLAAIEANHCRNEEVKDDGSNLLKKLMCSDSRSITDASYFIISTALRQKNERISLLKECNEHYSLIEKKIEKHRKFAIVGEYELAQKALQIIRELYDRDCFCDLSLDPNASSIEWLIKQGYLLAEPITDFPEKYARKCVIECPVCHSQYIAYEQYVGSWVEIRMFYTKIR